MKIQLAFAFALPLLANVAFAASASSADTMFVTKAAQGNYAEVAMGQIAVANGDSAGVKQLGQRLIDDHGKNNDALKIAVGTSGIAIPTAPTQAQNDDAAKMKALSGMQFDHQFASMMVKDHEADIAMFRKEAASGDNADLRAYAKATLPTLEAHLQIAKQLAH